MAPSSGELGLETSRDRGMAHGADDDRRLYGRPVLSVSDVFHFRHPGHFVSDPPAPRPPVVCPYGFHVSSIAVSTSAGDNRRSMLSAR